MLDVEDIINLPVDFDSELNECIVSIMWTSALLRKAHKRIFENQLSSDAQFNILTILRDTKENLTQNDLSKKLMVDKSNITGLIDRLERQTLIKRLKVAGDRRKYHVALTEKGREIVKNLDSMYIDKMTTVLKSLSDGEVKKVIELLRKVRQGLVKISD